MRGVELWFSFDVSIDLLWDVRIFQFCVQR